MPRIAFIDGLISQCAGGADDAAIMKGLAANSGCTSTGSGTGTPIHRDGVPNV